MIVAHAVGVAMHTAEPSVLRFVLTAVGAWAVSEASFRYFETPFLRLKSRT
jgi:peptidoglycan/LPS O-acetylase OafA/YrhL